MLTWEEYWWIGWWKLHRNTSFSQTLFFYLFHTLIGSSLFILSLGPGFSCWVFLQCSLQRMSPFPFNQLLLLFQTLFYLSDYVLKSLFLSLMFRKYEEITPPHVEEFCSITDNTYNKYEVEILFYLFIYHGSLLSYHFVWICDSIFSVNGNNVGSRDGSWHTQDTRFWNGQSYC